MADKRGYFDKILAFDVETSAICFDNIFDPSDGCQIVSIGIIVLERTTFNEIERLYLEIKWDGKSKWSNEAEAVHGLSKEYLDVHGVSEEEAVIQIGTLIQKYWPLQLSINCLGHNLVGFDIIFLKKLFSQFGIELNMGNRHIDTFGLMQTLFGAFNSDEGFSAIGLKDRECHNALEDIEMTVEFVRRVRVLWKAKVGL